MLSNKQSKADRKTLCSKTLPSSDSRTERRARLSLGFLFNLPPNTADSLSLFGPSQLPHVCHSVSPTVCLSRLLALPLPAFPKAKTPLRRKARGCREGGRETQEMGNLNEATTYSAAVGPNPYLVLLCGHWVGLGRYYAALSNVADVTVVARRCLSNTNTTEGNLGSFLFGF